LKIYLVQIIHKSKELFSAEKPIKNKKTPLKLFLNRP
jgi:hypothetical protein